MPDDPTRPRISGPDGGPAALIRHLPTGMVQVEGCYYDGWPIPDGVYPLSAWHALAAAPPQPTVTDLQHKIADTMGVPRDIVTGYPGTGWARPRGLVPLDADRDRIRAHYATPATWRGRPITHRYVDEPPTLHYASPVDGVTWDGIPLTPSIAAALGLTWRDGWHRVDWNTLVAPRLTRALDTLTTARRTLAYHLDHARGAAHLTYLRHTGRTR